jgi:hypothetical protein
MRTALTGQEPVCRLEIESWPGLFEPFRGASEVDFCLGYAAIGIAGRALKCASLGVNRPRLEWARRSV